MSKAHSDDGRVQQPSDTDHGVGIWIKADTGRWHREVALHGDDHELACGGGLTAGDDVAAALRDLTRLPSGSICSDCRSFWTAECGRGDIDIVEAEQAVVPTEHAEYWQERAEANLKQWGEQSTETLLLALQEELGELTRAHLEARHEGGDAQEIQAELDDLVPLCWQLQWAIEREWGAR